MTYSYYYDNVKPKPETDGKKGWDCKVCGYWKVYSNVERATRLFRLYDACRDSLLLQLDTGRRIVDLTFPQRACLPA